MNAGNPALASIAPSTTQWSACAHGGHLVQFKGAGINEELLPRVFDMFTQAERSLDRKSGGAFHKWALGPPAREEFAGHIDAPVAG